MHNCIKTYNNKKKSAGIVPLNNVNLVNAPKTLQNSYSIKCTILIRMHNCINVARIRKQNIEHGLQHILLLKNCNTYMSNILYKSIKYDVRLNNKNWIELSAAVWHGTENALDTYRTVSMHFWPHLIIKNHTKLKFCHTIAGNGSK